MLEKHIEDEQRWILENWPYPFGLRQFWAVAALLLGAVVFKTTISSSRLASVPKLLATRMEEYYEIGSTTTSQTDFARPALQSAHDIQSVHARCRFFRRVRSLGLEVRSYWPLLDSLGCDCSALNKSFLANLCV